MIEDAAVRRVELDVLRHRRLEMVLAGETWWTEPRLSEQRIWRIREADRVETLRRWQQLHGPGPLYGPGAA